MSKIARFVGLDVHKATIAVAVAEAGAEGDPKFLGEMPFDAKRLVKRLEGLGPTSQLAVAYEAGPTGYGLCRHLRKSGIACQVIAPSKMPRHSGDRVKTDRRDALKLAKYLSTGQLTPIRIPSERTEALRDLIRARGDAKQAQLTARHHLSTFLLRHDQRYTQGKSHWTQIHLQWIHSLEFDEEALRRVRDDYLHEVERLSERVERLSQAIEELSAHIQEAPLVHALQALRGVKTLTAAAIAAEIGDLHRFRSPRKLMAYLGLVPSEFSSGSSVVRGAITKTGNRHVRRLLVEAAWAYRYKPRVGPTLRSRQRELDVEVRQIAWKAQGRLHHRYVRMLARGKSPQRALVAMARELCGFIWAIAQRTPIAAA
jgi:transposase